LPGEIPGLLDGLDDVLVEPFVLDGAVVALDVGVRLGLAGLDVLDRDAPFLGPDQQLVTNVFRAVVDPYGAGFAAPFYNSVKTSDDPLGRQREVDLEIQHLTVEIVQYVQAPKYTSVAETISHEIH
jgi:hypothetical protein